MTGCNAQVPRLGSNQPVATGRTMLWAVVMSVVEVVVRRGEIRER